MDNHTFNFFVKPKQIKKGVVQEWLDLRIKDVDNGDEENQDTEREYIDTARLRKVKKISHINLK